MTTSNSSRQTRGQLQRTLSQRIQKLYKEDLGHSPAKVSCQVVDNKVTIIVEDSLTKAEQLLIEEKETKSSMLQSDVGQLRSDLDMVIRPKITSIVEEILAVSVIDLLSDTTLETGRTGFLIVLAESPKVVASASERNELDGAAD